MLEENENHRLKILTDILIERKFLDVYYTTLRQEGADVAKIQLETLKFLKILQRYVFEIQELKNFSIKIVIYFFFL